MGDYGTPGECYSQTDIRNINRDFPEMYAKMRAISVLKSKTHKHTQTHISTISTFTKIKPIKLYRITENEENIKKYLLNFEKNAILTS